MDISRITISQNETVSNALKRIDEIGKKIVFVVDDDKKLTGSFTDGDMRRYLLKNGDFSMPVTRAMYPSPTSFNIKDKAEAKMHMEKTGMLAIPLVDDDMHIVDVCFWNDIEISQKRRTFPCDVPVVIMAGGKGSRLYPYTKILPKPLIPIGDSPITELIMNRFADFGSNNFWLVLNHKKNMIKAYFNDAELNYKINYVEEEKFLGTGGGLSLLKGKLNTTFFLSNCDCLLDSDYVCMYDYHKSHNNILTIVCAIKNIVIPYGVIDVDENGNIKNMREKPEFSYLTNTGIYLMEPQALDIIKDNEYIDMPDIANILMAQGHNVGVYPITEKSWLDMGQISEMKKMLEQLDIKD